jgi:FkbM family methyltransferase
MDLTSTPADPSAAAPAPGPIRRRDLLAGGVGLVTGLSGGLVANAMGGRRLQPGEKIVPAGVHVSYAQAGDDLVAASLFAGLGIPRPSFLDVGAFDPVNNNNTYLFYQGGARGVLVEPNPAITERLERVRPGDTVVVAGLGTDERTEADYYMLDNPRLNTFDKDQAERVARETGHVIKQVVKVPMLTINRVIEGHFGGKAPDYISIDIEGMDFAVLKTLDFARYRPKVICAETLVANTTRHNPDTTKLLVDNGYEVRGLNWANTFYVDRKLLGG